MNRPYVNKLLWSASALALMTIASQAQAQTAPSAEPSADDAPPAASDIIVTGTRQTGVRASDSAAPISLVGADTLKRVGMPDLTQALQQNLPSFNAQSFGYDAAALTVSAALRGVSPNDTLVLVNGKRRHSTANLAVDSGSPYSGAATADLSLIPVGAIDHVEVLQDGAAAQYGSDAIAGVINIILKKQDHGGSISVTGGQYYAGDGKTASWTINKGLALGDHGYFNITVSQDYHEHTQRGTVDVRYFTPDGHLLPGLNAIAAAGLAGAKDSPNVNHQFGDPNYNIYKGFVNAGYDLGGGVELYGFGSYAHRTSSAYENYRAANVLVGTTSTGQQVVPYPNGFNPREKIVENDYAVTGGLRGSNGGWNWDLSTTYGRDRHQVYTVDSANVDLFQTLQRQSATPIAPETDFYDGSFAATQWTTNLDITHDFDLGLAKPLSLAFGGEYRRETFGIEQGSPSSLYGFGAASYPGFAPTDQGTHARHSYAGYLDIAFNPFENWKIDVAGRYEHYSDFGNNLVGKLTTRYDFSPAFAVRGTVSNGFRAPTLAEEYYSATSVTPNGANVQIPANSPAAKVAGFSPLKPEKSTSFSFGFVAHPVPRLQLTVDAYQIRIRDRIFNSNFLLGSFCSGTPLSCTVVAQGVVDAIRTHGNNIDSSTLNYTGVEVFSNGATSRTRGVEATLNYASDFGDFGRVDWSAGFSYNKTDITDMKLLPAQVSNAAFGQTQLLGPLALSSLTTATPRVKVVLGALLTHDKWTFNLRDTIYGSTSQIFSRDGTGNSGASGPATVGRIGTTSITDLEVGYSFTRSLKLAVGANNLFDHSPPTMPNVTLAGAPNQPLPADGHNVLNFPLPFAPWGINGGYYYARATLSF
ncbi:MAG: TonB-dependent receptor [Bradyrhizobium sp.]|nr:TonB-dependent receptor [Bradyrhizobium sp.]